METRYTSKIVRWRKTTLSWYGGSTFPVGSCRWRIGWRNPDSDHAS